MPEVGATKRETKMTPRASEAPQCTPGVPAPVSLLPIPSPSPVALALARMSLECKPEIPVAPGEQRYKELCLREALAVCTPPAPDL